MHFNKRMEIIFNNRGDEKGLFFYFCIVNIFT